MIIFFEICKSYIARLTTSKEQSEMHTSNSKEIAETDSFIFTNKLIWKISQKLSFSTTKLY